MQVRRMVPGDICFRGMSCRTAEPPQCTARSCAPGDVLPPFRQHMVADLRMAVNINCLNPYRDAGCAMNVAPATSCNPAGVTACAGRVRQQCCCRVPAETYRQRTLVYTPSSPSTGSKSSSSVVIVVGVKPSAQAVSASDAASLGAGASRRARLSTCCSSSDSPKWM